MKEYRFIPEISLDRTSIVPLRLQIIKQMRQDIISNRVPPGTRVLSERQMSQTLDVNRNTVHQAYMELVADGLLEFKTSRGGPRISKEALKIYEMSFPCINFLLPYTFGEYVASSGGNNSMWLEYVAGLLDHASQCGISVNILAMPPPDASVEQINEWLKRFIHRSIGTIILGSREIEYDPVFDALIKCTKVPHVFLNGTSDYENVSTVVADVSCGCNEMLEHFAEQGVRELGLVYFEKNEYNKQFHYASGTRTETVEKLAVKHNFKVKKYIFPLSFGSDEQRSALLADELLADKNAPRTLWCFNDTTAIAVLKEFERRKIRVPEDFRIAAYDNSAPAELELSSIAHSRVKLAQTAVDMLVDMLENGEPVKIKHQVLPTGFFARTSSGKGK